MITEKANKVKEFETMKVAKQLQKLSAINDASIGVLEHGLLRERVFDCARKNCALVAVDKADVQLMATISDYYHFTVLVRLWTN